MNSVPLTSSSGSEHSSWHRHARVIIAAAVAVVVALVWLPAANADEPLSPDAEVLIDFDSTWRYHDGDEDLGTSWRQPDYDDSEWGEGAALLGYDTSDRRGRWPEPGLQTELQPHLITYYFRTEFEYDGPTEGVRLRLDQIIDDGAVYYLNGEEIGRSELMPSGDIGFGTRTTTWTNPSVEHDVFEIDASHLREGRNVLAVSVHNQSTRSSDICLGARLSVSEATEPPHALYLTWQRDPTTTMTIQWHELEEDDTVRLEYARIDSNTLREVDSETHEMVFAGRPIHTVELTDLEPNSVYRFRITRDDFGRSSDFYTFRTMPDTADTPVRLAIGGDVRHRQSWMERTNLQALRFEPHAVVWGGDLAYADGREDRLDRWEEFLEACTNTLISEDGHVIPIIVGIGNHEILGGYYWRGDRGRDAYEDSDEFRESIAPYFYNLFAFPGHPGYGVLDVGDYMSIIVLDTDHSGPVVGTQTEWLAETLTEREHVPHVFPVYHVPAYPSVRRYDGGVTTRVRENWTPLFERHGVRLAFENHDHAYKRTVPIIGEEAHEDGVVYIGDGAWGVGVREVHDAEETWYLDNATSQRHFILVTVHGDHQDVKVINEHGRLIDHHVSRPFRRELSEEN